jgi:phosphatidate cytidylyltransferase
MVSRFLHYQLDWQIDWFGIYLFSLFLIVVAELFRFSKTPFQNISMSFMAMIYIGLSFSLLSEILFTAYTAVYSAYLLAFVLVIIWVHDSGAYVVGLLIGRHPLIKTISPKKTIEGLFGGIALGGLAIWGFSFFIEIPTTHLWIIGFVVMLFANLGDLFESKWKRHLGIKDSGSSLPGHGGWLDRLDSFLFVIPAVYFVILLLS